MIADFTALSAAVSAVSLHMRAAQSSAGPMTGVCASCKHAGSRNEDPMLLHTLFRLPLTEFDGELQHKLAYLGRFVGLSGWQAVD